MNPTLDQIMERMGFPATETGPYVTQLRALVARQMSQGMVERSAGSWAGDFDCETRAKAFLAVEWAIEHGHCHQTECLDSFPITRYYSTRDMRWHYSFRPRRIMPWLRDRVRLLGFHWRTKRDWLLGRSNPFAHLIGRYQNE